MDTSLRTPVVLLDSCAQTPVELVGVKAHHLATAMAAGFRVPQGAVITTAVFTAWLSFRLGGGSGGGAVDTSAGDRGFPAEAELAVDTVLDALGEGPFAVRSSSAAEDLEDASFAGQYATTLGVRGRAELIRAVLRTWESARGPAPTAYRATATDNPGGMAVLVQHLIPAEESGVAFSADPVSGERQLAVVDAVRGLAEDLVSGRAVPDEWEVRRGVARRRSSGVGPGAGRATVLAAAELALRAERHLGVPVDIEWALARGTVFLLQARPITALPPQPAPLHEVPEGFWQLDAGHFPRPVSPLAASFLPQIASSALSGTFTQFGILADSLQMRCIGGRLYVRVVPLGGRERRLPPRWLFWLLVRTNPQMRHCCRVAAETVLSGEALRLVRAWTSQDRAGMEAAIKALKTSSLSELDDRQLAQRWKGLTELVRRGWGHHALLHGASMLILGRLREQAMEVLGWDEHQALQLLAGLSSASMLPGQALDALAARAAAAPALRSALASGQGAAFERLRSLDHGFAEDFLSYLRDFGDRTLGYDPADPTLEEQPDEAVGLLAERVQWASGRDDANRRLRQERVAEAKTALAAAEPGRALRFWQALAEAEEAYPVREDNVAWNLARPTALLRGTALEVGNRLSDRGQLPSAQDVFLLTEDEAVSALEGGEGLHRLIQGRREERQAAQLGPAAPSYGTASPKPPLDLLPPTARFVHQCLDWYFNSIFAFEELRDRVPETSADTHRLRGIGASPGEYSGPVRVVHDDSEFPEVQPGDVVVAVSTSPTWSVVFSRVGALVTEQGGALSHPAIIAREYRIPAVVATQTATKVLRTGQIVRVNGAAGTVDVLEGA